MNTGSTRKNIEKKTQNESQIIWLKLILCASAAYGEYWANFSLIFNKIRQYSMFDNHANELAPILVLSGEIIQ